MITIDWQTVKESEASGTAMKNEHLNELLGHLGVSPDSRRARDFYGGSFLPAADGENKAM